jgi:hypothetical protein
VILRTAQLFLKNIRSLPKKRKFPTLHSQTAKERRKIALGARIDGNEVKQNMFFGFFTFLPYGIH